jgi:hypothetical protein
MYSGYVLFCDSPVQEDCLKNRKYTCADNQAVPTAKIKVGTILFLYNAEKDTLLGPFTSLSEGADNVDEGAWQEDIDNHSASQNVTLNWERLHKLTNAAVEMPFLKEPTICALTTTQTQRALDLLKEAPLHEETEE